MSTYRVMDQGRSPRLRSLLLTTCVALGMVLSPFTAASPAGAAKLVGIGDSMARWQASFSRDGLGCDAPNCYGPKVSNSSAHFEFSYVTTFKGRVDGFDLALARGTSLVRAQLEVAQLFPGDIQMGSLTVIHTDSLGKSCAVYDLQSKTLEHVFGKQAFGQDGGNIGVELARVLPNGDTTYQPGEIDIALVVPTYLGSDANC
jgi:hypothetical protein